jgi:methionine-rich copper-binding protein CopC
MKQAMKTTRMITMGLFTLCAMGLSQATFAGAKTDDPIEFKFIGKVKNHPVFQLNLNNNEAEEYFIKIKDENYNVLYSAKVKATDANYSRKYRLDIDQDDLNADGFAIRVEVTSAKTHVTRVYKISSHLTVNDNIIVAKL